MRGGQIRLPSADTDDGEPQTEMVPASALKMFRPAQAAEAKESVDVGGKSKDVPSEQRFDNDRASAKDSADFWMSIVTKFQPEEQGIESLTLAQLMDSYGQLLRTQPTTNHSPEFPTDLTRRRLTALFKRMDEDDGGTISKDEFRQGLENIGKAVVKPFKSLIIGSILGLYVRNDKDYDEMFAKVDTSGDGDIELDEVRSYLTVILVTQY